ncbi:NitT/TauT family transport system substrate-binding protein [Halobacillus karajensis]|uniref:Aliphatic sulfonates-binding protein n=1 Tax=Halobacillus karajensis TaxID=195088 RepID=A0A024P5K3_9BACI|nr:aliphatic sulfonate ABC transporter substrate-binding protein [Halobacillus karajensis]CDQ20391.1 Putative aliphatic sulfonates-binding protein precursor [Halobacillus karajensis]CDQ24140.1 Putative aliphatic sulfonates-binding protein precursor [Halobacillus karajensis]CDQ27618.1 Putative aliphatic sulfonates-binding protein precursor [Halobacillus karajensis]SEH92366.1 NitT/TauT family transport system substrate-binding protein [Halobacillus karajensis]
MKKWLSIAVIAILSVVLAACGSDAGANGGDGNKNNEITIGYFPNINHVAGMVAETKDLYSETLPDGTKVNYQYFPDGSSFMTAIETGDIQGGLVGPGPAMNHFTSGAEINVVAAGSTGGTVIMAREGAGINSPEDLKGKTFVSPRVGCTHDVQFETLMKEEFSLTSDRINGEMKHVTGKPATYSSLFETQNVDVATVPEPWASSIEAEGSGKVLIDTPEVAFGETLPAAVFVTSQELVEEDPEMVQNIVDAHKKATDFINENPEEAKQIAIDKIKDITDQELSKEVIDRAWERIDFTYDVNEEHLQEFADSSYDLEFLKEKPDLTGLVDKSFID